MGKITRSIHCKFLSFAFIFLTVAKYMNYNKGSAFAILYSPKLIPNSRIAELNTSLKKGIYSICSSNLPLNIRNWSQDSLSYIGLYKASQDSQFSWVPVWCLTLWKSQISIVTMTFLWICLQLIKYSILNDFSTLS